MDHRKALAPGETLDFPGMHCTVEREIGRGSNAIVYRGWYPDLLNQNQRHTVLIKELFPFHMQNAIFRKEDGCISILPEGRETWEWHRRSFEYGNKAHLSLLEKYPHQTGANLNTFSLHGTLYTLLGFTGGKSMGEAIPGPEKDLRKLAVRMLGLLNALEAFHENGWAHLDIAPDNILLIGPEQQEQIMLIDYNSVQRFDASPDESPAYFSVKPGYTAPEARTMRGSAISPAADLYSVAAVFFRCLTGNALTPFQSSRPAPPDISQCPCLQNMPETVRSMAQNILQRGLQTLPRRRYASVQEMRLALQELLDRIDGVGVTHWALWEAGKRSVEKAIRENPSYAYIQREAALYPSNVKTAQGDILSMTEFMAHMTEGKKGHSLLIAPGGMGKTTAMLRFVLEQSGKYTPASCAVLYLSLYDHPAGRPFYLHDRILNMLRFSKETRSMEDARHALDALMEKPLPVREGERPGILLLLDGFNEMGGDLQAVQEELAALSAHPGLRILISSRKEEASLPFQQARLIPLTPDNVQSALQAHGLLLPPSKDMQELLRTPLMLSIFIQSAPCEGGLMMNSREELMQAYFSALEQKEKEKLPADAPEKWQLDAAVHFLLPALAAEMKKRRRTLRDGELLKITEKCFRLIASPLLRRIFPRWIGRRKAILGGALDAEAWYGLMVHDLLWKRLGLLIRTDELGYQITHQLIGEYLEKKYISIHRKFILQRRIFIGSILMAAAIGFFLFRPQLQALKSAVESGAQTYQENIRKKPAYEVSEAEDLLSFALSGYVQADHVYASALELISCAEKDPGQLRQQFSFFQQSNPIMMLEIMEEEALNALHHIHKEGHVIPWSRQEIEKSLYEELAAFARMRKAEYEQCAQALLFFQSDPLAREKYSVSFLEAFKDLISQDGRMAALLYQAVYLPHDQKIYAENKIIKDQNEALKDSARHLNALLQEEEAPESLVNALQQQRKRREECLHAINSGAAMGYYRLHHKGGKTQ